MITMVDSGTVGDPALHLDIAALEAGLERLDDAAKDAGRVALLVRRGEGGVRETPEKGYLSGLAGLEGDAWGREADRHPDAQLTVMEVGVARLIANGQPLTLFGDQVLVDLDLSKENLPLGSRVRMGSAVLEVTAKPHNGCQKYRARFGTDALRFVSRPDLRHRNFRGVYFRVVEDGEVAVGDEVTVLSR
jgi:MOSC domain-containing protein YiiM